ncbi:aspartyl protease family protein [Tunturibacter psychrotolerans]|uniref:Aspartyl protease family protein n=1 Tax=Tunturiibacter psychrotolerans TaxID=3069686 RepID=A0AAU7ZMT0_9BACT
MKVLAPELLYSLLFSFLLTSTSPAQSSPAASNATCKIDKTPPTDTEVAFYRRDFKKAADLAAAGYKADPKDSRSRQLEIDSLIGLGKLDDARKMIDPWTLAEPTNPVAIVTAGELRYAEGDWIESYALMLKALKIDPCLPSAYEGLAGYESLAGYHSTAQKHLALAHQLSPNNDNIRFAWINSLNDAQSTAELASFIHDSKTLDDKRRTNLTTQLNQNTSSLKNRCELSSVTTPVRIPMTPVYGAAGIDHYGLEIAFNGHKRTLQIDTGASGFLLTQSVYAGMGLQKISSSHVWGFGDQEANAIDLFTAASVRIGGVEFKNCNVSVLDNFGVLGGGHIGQAMDTGGGLVGTDIFSRYLVTLDYVKHEIRLEPLPQPPSPAPAPLDALGGDPANDLSSFDRFKAPTMQNWTSIYRRDHLIIMPTVINSSKPTLFVVDTGSFTNMIDTNFAKQVTHTKESTTYSRGLSGMSNLLETGSFTADFAGLRLPVVGMNSQNLSRFNGVHGFLGYPTLQQLVMHIDYRDNLVLFEAPNAHK